MKHKRESITRPVCLDDKERISGILAACGHDGASHGFQSIFIWQEAMGLSIHLKEDLLAVRTSLRGENAWFFPCGSSQAKKEFLMEHRDEEDFFLCYARKEDVDLAIGILPPQFQFRKSPEDSEYLYDVQEQRSLQGRRFAKLRNHIRRMEREHRLETIPLTEKNSGFAFEILKGWERQSHEAGRFGLRDEDASRLLLHNLEVLEVQGNITMVDGVPGAVTAGYPLSDTVFDLCMAKQVPGVSGLSAYAKWKLYMELPEHFLMVNGEEDLGIEGLRRMKCQMEPSGMLVMYEGCRHQP